MDFSIRDILQNRIVIVAGLILLGIMLVAAAAYIIFPEVRDGGMPSLRVEGIAENDRIADACTLVLYAQDGETIVTNTEISIDDTPVFSSAINTADYSGKAEINCAGFSEGEHILLVVVYDGALFRHKSESHIRFWIDRTPPAVETKLLSTTVKQGNTMAIYLKSNEELFDATVVFKNKPYPLDLMDADMQVYGAFIPVPVLNAIEQDLVLCQFSDRAGNRAENSVTVAVVPGNFQKERIEVPKGKVAIFADTNARRRQTEYKSIVAAYATHNTTKFWTSTFIHPTQGRESSAYGTQRVYSTGIVASYHKGIDLASRESPPIFAANYGTVIFARETLVYGNMIIIDHGYGIMTMYGHMSKLLVGEGDHVARKQQIGIVGDTGLATGPHLHWEMRIHGREVNPLQWETTDFEHPWKEKL